jgi:hypothetical protein
MRDSSFSSLDSSKDGAGEAQDKRTRTAIKKGARSWRRGLVEGRKRNVGRVSRLLIISSRFARYTASSEGYYLRGVYLFPVSGVLFTCVAGELKAKDDIMELNFRKLLIIDSIFNINKLRLSLLINISIINSNKIFPYILSYYLDKTTELYIYILINFNVRSIP